MYDQIITDLRDAYNKSAERRDQAEKSAWKIRVRQSFLILLQRENKRSLLEIGAGAGIDGRFFQENGLEVTCTDLSPEMVRLCLAKGLAAHVMDFFDLDFPDAHFDAVYALNCLLHVPKSELPRVLQRIGRILKPGGLFFMGVYGGIDQEGVWADDDHDPQRFFALYTDEGLQMIASQFFIIHQFKTVQMKTAGIEPHFQLLVLRQPQTRLLPNGDIDRSLRRKISQIVDIATNDIIFS